MTVNSNMAEPNGRHRGTAAISFSKITHGFLAILARFRANAKSTLKVLQMARMMSVLSNMSDHQLAQIGIQRAEIPKYAETLMANE
ncbi:DUF1127 domain-containing protein [Falsihalocynthiibacter sp. S25ZX9]|uniref:DUF1127 domain-containing protein n=1 Tax=Falsihalocynthiibacter sp. S25ZX9 TaxID=3240870 RepID=UPI0035107BBE